MRLVVLNIASVSYCQIGKIYVYAREVETETLVNEQSKKFVAP